MNDQNPVSPNPDAASPGTPTLPEDVLLS